MTRILAALKPFGKALAPAGLAAVVALANLVQSGGLNSTSLKVLGAGLLSSVVAYLVPNAQKATAKPVPVNVVPVKKIDPK